MKNYPILMEDFFTPGFRPKPAVHVGSQTLNFFKNDPWHQAWEGIGLAGAFEKDIAVVRNIDPKYIDYWTSLMGTKQIINIEGKNPGSFLTEVILNDRTLIKSIKNSMDPESRLMVFLPTRLEHALAKRLRIPLHGSSRISDLYGTKSGIRLLAKEAGIAMSPGFTCATYREIKEAINKLGKDFDYVVLKHDLSISGYFSKKLRTNSKANLKNILDDLVGGKFINGKDNIVVEGWLKAKTSLCAHIEILENRGPILCSAWQQLIDSDGISYMGGGPIILSAKAMSSFINSVNKIAKILKEKGAIGTYAPDFLVTADDETRVEPDSCILIELNARVPYTAFGIEIVRKVKGKIGNGFYVSHVNLKKKSSFGEIVEALESSKLLIKKTDSSAKGVVPYNVGLLPWKLFDIVVMADTWEETLHLARKTMNIFNNQISKDLYT